MAVQGEAVREQRVIVERSELVDTAGSGALEEELQSLARLLSPEGDGAALVALPGVTARARRLTLSALESWGLGGHGEVAEQLVAELVANAVRHTGGRTFVLRVLRGSGRIRIELRDPSRALPCLIRGDVEDEAGRGLCLVDQLADRWGVDVLSHGKSVWFELRTRPAV
ncbi:ATP-binding protein [Streptacidiphilus jiangxiensis]|uniref:ATP-binding protein n=1 Tax=Streptacidiphilus jiangxiensis TaxID=235985 RepID=UPI0007C84F12|nr:ATP-binding protein [Streptacidiphilus jiangxiensis]